MIWRARLLLVSALGAAPAYLALDALGRLPLALRDRPWPFALFAFACAAAAYVTWRRASAPSAASPSRRLASRRIALAVSALVSGVSCGATGAAARWRYQLPPASPDAHVGEQVPDLALHDQSGAPLTLRGGDRPLLLIWFRGAWCPYCRRQLAELAAELARHGDAGVRTLAVAPDPPPPLATLKQELALPFTLISDPERRLVNRCELAHCVAIADARGVIRWAVVSGNWERDLPARALLQAAYRLR